MAGVYKTINTAREPKPGERFVLALLARNSGEWMPQDKLPNRVNSVPVLGRCASSATMRYLCERGWVERGEALPYPQPNAVYGYVDYWHLYRITLPGETFIAAEPDKAQRGRVGRSQGV